MRSGEQENLALGSSAPCSSASIMAPGSRILKRLSSDEVPKQSKLAASRSPPPSPRIEQRPRLREPCPVPSTNPASQYTLLEKLGTGSFGTVYKAMHNETKQIVAIKQIGKLVLGPTLGP